MLANSRIRKRGFTPLEMGNLNRVPGNASGRIKRKKRFLSLTGLTLLELIITIIIITIMFGALVAMKGSFEHRQRVEMSAVKLVGDLRQAWQFSRVRRDEYNYYGLRFFDNVGVDDDDDGIPDREGWKILRFCQTNSDGDCIGDPTEIPFDATRACYLSDNTSSCEIIKSSEENEDGRTPELVEKTYFGKNVTIDTTISDLQIGDTMVFNPEGSATTDGATPLPVSPPDNSTAKIIPEMFGNTKTVKITPLTGHIGLQ